MLRSLSTRRSQHTGYERLGDEHSARTSLPEPKFERAKSLSTFTSTNSSKLDPDFLANIPNGGFVPVPSIAEPAKKISKIHPLFSLFETRRKKKATAKPEFSRYVEYVKEAGVWDGKSGGPVMHYG